MEIFILFYQVLTVDCNTRSSTMMEKNEKSRYNSHPKAPVRKPVLVERLQRREEVTNQTLSVTSVNFQLISVQRMDTVLHLVQRKLFKQKEQRVFANFMRNCSSQSSGDPFADGRVENCAAATHTSSIGVQTVRISDGRPVAANSGLAKNASPQAGSMDEIMVKNLAAELKSCIKDLRIVLKQEMKSTVYGERTRAYETNAARYGDRKKPSPRMKSRSEIAPFGKPPTGITRNSRRLPTNVVKREIKFPTGTGFTNSVDLQKTQRSRIMPHCNSWQRLKQHRSTDENDAENKFDVAALWHQLESIEKVEESVRQRHQLMRLDRYSANVTEPVDNAGCMSIEDDKEDAFAHRKSSSYVANWLKQSADKSSDENEMPVLSRRVRQGGETSSVKYLPVSSGFQTHNVETWLLAKELSNTLLNDFATEASNGVSGLPEDFLRELFEKEFAS